MQAQLIVGDTHQPGGEAAAAAEAGDAFQRGQEGLGGQVLRVAGAAKTRQVVAIDPVDMPVVKLGEGSSLLLCQTGQVFIAGGKQLRLTGCFSNLIDLLHGLCALYSMLQWEEKR